MRPGRAWEPVESVSPSDGAGGTVCGAERDIGEVCGGRRTHRFLQGLGTLSGEGRSWQPRCSGDLDWEGQGRWALAGE